MNGNGNGNGNRITSNGALRTTIDLLSKGAIMLIASLMIPWAMNVGKKFDTINDSVTSLKVGIATLVAETGRVGKLEAEVGSLRNQYMDLALKVSAMERN